MDREENSSRGQAHFQTGVRPDEVDRRNGSRGGIPAQSDVTTPATARTEIRPEVLVAIISAIATITVALLGFPPLVDRLTPDPTATPSLILTSTITPSPFFTDTPVIIFTDTISPTILPSATSTVTATATASETITLIPRPKLVVLLTANKNSGKPPLKVKFDARDTYLTDYDAQTYICRDGLCDYTWKVYFNEQPMGKAEKGSGGTFDYTFGKRGTYRVTVWICRGRDRLDCGGAGVQIIVT